jgi:hypothetical protein
MQRLPCIRMTRRTVAARNKVLTDGGADQNSVRTMTAGTAVMRIRRSTHQSIIMAVSAAGRTHRHQ